MFPGGGTGNGGRTCCPPDLGSEKERSLAASLFTFGGIKIWGSDTKIENFVHETLRVGKKLYVTMDFMVICLLAFREQIKSIRGKDLCFPVVRCMHVL